MGLKDRIEDEMVVDTESMLDDHFEEAKQLFRIFQDGSIDIAQEYENASWKEKILIYLIGQQYAYQADKVEAPTLPYEFFYARVGVEKSTVRKYMGELQDDLIVKKNDENGEWRLVTDNFPEALSRVEKPDS